MQTNNPSLQDIQHIKTMMERSSRFISLSGLSGIAAGICALIGAWVAGPYVFGYKDYMINQREAVVQALANNYSIIFNTWLFWIAFATFSAALVSAFFFTWLRSKKQGTSLWGSTSKRLLFNIAIPLVVGGLFIIKLAEKGAFGLIAPGCLIFYGLALLNASKYTFIEIRYLAIGQLLLGIINMWFVGYGLYFWAIGFGVLHIVYGALMWNKYERSKQA